MSGESGDKATRYGGENAPPRNQEMPEPTAPWSVKQAMRKTAQEKIKGKLRARRVAERLFTQAEKGDVSAARTILEHLDGKPPQSVNIGGQGLSNPVRTETLVVSTNAEEAYRRMLERE